MAKENGQNDAEDIPHLRKEARPNFSKPPPPAKLPAPLQKTLDNDESLWETLYEGDAPESTSSNLRYAAYASRIRTILLSAHRYVAYTSDIGESFRPIAHPWLIKGAYGVSWAYLAGDVAHEGYKAYCRNQRVLHPDLAHALYASSSENEHVRDEYKSETERAKYKGLHAVTTASAATKDLVKPAPPSIALVDDYRAVMAQRAVFQGIASMGLPAFTIHSIVRYSGKALKNAKNTRIRTYGPIGLGLAAVPFLPYLFDKPVEEAVEWTFHSAFGLVGAAGAKGQGKGEKEL